MSDRLQEIRARLDAATPGPWDDGPRWAHGHDVFAVSDGSPLSFIGLVPKSSDADLIAHAPDDIAWLLRRLEFETRLVADLEAQLDRAHERYAAEVERRRGDA